MPSPRSLAILAAAAALVAAAPPALGAGSPFDGVWQVVPRGPPGGPPGGGGPGGPRPQGPPPGATQGAQRGGPRLPEKLAAMLDNGDRHVFGQMTPAGQAMFATFDPKLLPANNCRTPGLPSIAMTPDLQEWRVAGGKLTIHHENFDTRREIALDGAARPPGPPSVLGFASGKIEGGAVSFETTGLAAAWSGLGRNAPASDARVVREIYRLDGPDTLSGHIEIEDAKFLTTPIRLAVTLRRAPAGTKIESFPCDLEASKRDAGG
jgi:hypothetical protein